MEVDDIQRQQEVCKFQKITSNGDNNSSKLATQKANHHYFDEDTTAVTAAAAAAVCGWPSSRIVRVSRASGGKDRHSKVLTSKGLRDRRVRLSVTTAIQFYDLQDRLGYDQPSKAVEWLIKAASSSISELPSLDPSFSGDCNETHHFHHRKLQLIAAGDEKSINETEFEDPNNKTHHQNSKSSACSSTSENSKGSGVSLSRSENRIRARERAREMAAKKEKEKDGISQNSSFTDLLTGGGISSATVSPTAASPESRIHWTTTTTPMDYFFNRPPQMPQFNGENHHFSFLQENFSGGGGGGEGYNLNFSIAPSSSGGGGGVAPGFNRGTLQSNYYLQRFQSSSMVDGSTSTNFPFFIAPTIGATTTPEHFPATGYDSQRLQLYGGADGGRNHSDHRKEKSKN